MTGETAPLSPQTGASGEEPDKSWKEPDKSGKGPEKKEPKWTVMVFMGADTIEGNSPLGGAADADIAEMRAVGGGKNLDIFIQVHGRGDPKRYHFGLDDAGKQTETETLVAGKALTFSGGEALTDFIEYATEKTQHGPDDHSILVLWGHAYDFAFGRSRTPGGTIAAIDFAELSTVLRGLQTRMRDRYLKRYGGLDGPLPKLDVVGFDACDIATVEMACQLEPFAKYLLGSQIGIPIPGWPYDRILDRLQNPKGDLMAPPEFGSYVVRRFCELYDATRPVSLTLLNLQRVPELLGCAESLALELAVEVGNPLVRDHIGDLFFSSQTEIGKPFVDLADLCLNLVRYGSGASMIQKATELGDLLAEPHFPLAGKSKSGEGRPIVAEHGRNAGSLARLNGLSIYAPHVVPDDNSDAVRNHLYNNFSFAQKTRWSRLVNSFVASS